MSGLKDGARAGADRFLKPYLEPLSKHIESVRHDVVELVSEVRERLGAIETHNRAIADEVRGVRESCDIRLDHTNMRLHQILDEVGGVRDRFDVVARNFEEQALRQAELRTAFDETKMSLEKLELLMMAQLEGLFRNVESEAAAVRGEMVELTRMIRMQGDAGDQVAEVMGRALTRLSAEVETLSAVVPRTGAELAADNA